MKVRVLSAKDVEKLIDFGDAFLAAKAAHIAYGNKKTLQPPIVSMKIDQFHGELDIKSGANLEEDLIGIKVVTGFWNNPLLYKSPATGGLIILLDARTGFPLCIMDGSRLTYLRTAATGAYAATLLASNNSSILALIGAGELARQQALATIRYFDLKLIKIYDKNLDRAKKLAVELKNTSPIFVETTVTPREAVVDADIIITATNATQALVMKGDVKSGAHINAFGCDMPEKQELDPALFKGAMIVADCLPECEKRGEIHHGLAHGIITKRDIYAELGEIATDKKVGRTSSDGISIFDSVGMSIQDICISSKVYARAIKNDIGIWINI